MPTKTSVISDSSVGTLCFFPQHTYLYIRGRLTHVSMRIPTEFPKSKSSHYTILTITPSSQFLNHLWSHFTKFESTFVFINVNLKVIFIELVTSLRHMRSTCNGKWCFGSHFSRLKSTCLHWTCIDETQNPHCCRGFADVMCHQSIRYVNGFKTSLATTSDVAGCLINCKHTWK